MRGKERQLRRLKELLSTMSGRMLPQLQKFFGPVCQCLGHQDGDLVAAAIEVDIRLAQQISQNDSLPLTSMSYHIYNLQ